MTPNQEPLLLYSFPRPYSPSVPHSVSTSALVSPELANVKFPAITTVLGVAVGVGVTDGVGVIVGVAVGDGGGVDVGVGVGDGVAVGDGGTGEAVAVAVGVAVGVCVGVGAAVGEGVGVQVGVAVGRGIGVWVGSGIGDGEAEAVGVGNSVADAVGSGPTVGGTRPATAVASRALTTAALSDSTVASKSAVDVELEPGVVTETAVAVAVGLVVTPGTAVDSVWGRGNGVATGDSPQAATTSMATSKPELMTRPVQAALIIFFTSANQVE